MNAAHDENGRATMSGTSNVDGAAIVSVYANPTNHGLKVEDATTGSDLVNNQGIAMIDENGVAVWMAESSAGDGALVEVYVDPVLRALLINSL